MLGTLPFPLPIQSLGLLNQSKKSEGLGAVDDNARDLALAL
jgi:hypothetical protein